MRGETGMYLAIGIRPPSREIAVAIIGLTQLMNISSAVRISMTSIGLTESCISRSRKFHDTSLSCSEDMPTLMPMSIIGSIIAPRTPLSR